MRSTRLPSWIEQLAGLKPALPPPDVFTLSAEALRFGRLVAGGNGSSLAATDVQPVPPETFAGGPLGGPIQAPEAFGETVAALVERLSGKPESASLVIPDGWLRLTFIELAELPRKPRLREEILRWKLKRQVPFRVEELRVSAVEVKPFPGQEEPLRVLLGFAIELLLQQLEEAFDEAGVELGMITNQTLAAVAAAEEQVADDDLAAVVGVEPDAFSVCYFRRAEPLLYRHKELVDGGRDATTLAHRELRLIRSFVEANFSEAPLRNLFVTTPPGEEELWNSWLEEELGVASHPLAPEAQVAGVTDSEAAALYGAARIEVA